VRRVIVGDRAGLAPVSARQADAIQDDTFVGRRP
jgi:hypothetical protein